MYNGCKILNILKEKQEIIGKQMLKGYRLPQDQHVFGRIYYIIIIYINMSLFLAMQCNMSAFHWSFFNKGITLF